MDKLRVGDYITIKRDCIAMKWYHDKPMVIIDVIKSSEFEKMFKNDIEYHYRVDKFDMSSFPIELSDFYNDLIKKYGNILYEDKYVELSKSHLRMDKLERLFNI